MPPSTGGSGACASAPHAAAHDDLARRLQHHLRHLPVVLLADRLLPGSVHTEFVGVGPGGVTVIAGAPRTRGPVRVEHVHGMFGARTDALRSGTRDLTELLAPVQARAGIVTGLLGGAVRVTGALCLDDDAPDAVRPLEAGGVVIGPARSVAALAARPGTLIDTEVTAIVDLLCAACPPAAGQ